jgi:hypothetical protein
VNLPLVARVSADRLLTRRLTWPLGVVTLVGIVGIVVQRLLAPSAISSAVDVRVEPDTGAHFAAGAGASAGSAIASSCRSASAFAVRNAARSTPGTE